MSGPADHAAPATAGQGADGAAPAPVPRSALAVIFLTVLIDLLGFGIVLPVMPRQAGVYLAALGASPAAEGTTIGVLFSVFSLMQFIFSPWWGRVSDTIGRRPVLLVSLAGSVVFYALYGLAVTLPPERAPLALGLMLLSRIGAGIAGASVGTAAAVIADCTTPERRARGMALIGIAFGAGFTLGPLIAYFGLALFAEKPWGVGALASLLSFAAFLYALAAFRETRRPGSRAGRELPSAARTRAVLAMPAVGPLVLVYFLAIFAFANFEATLARFTQDAFGLTDNDNFLVFAAIGGVLVLAGGAYRPLAKRLPEMTLLSAGVSLLVLGMAALVAVAVLIHRGAAAGNPDAAGLRWWFNLAAAVSVAGFAFVNPSVSSLISRYADPERQGEVLGVNQSFASLGRILGPFAGSVLYSLSPTRALPYAVAAAVLCGVAGLLPRIARPHAGRP
jgi:DHA1 family tetracycline resistance protein-like MFS transporter